MTDSAAYEALGDDAFRASALTGGPWSPEHQHAGPPSALICRAVERAAAPHGFTHIGRLTVNLLRPLPVGDCRIEIRADQIGRGAGHFSGRSDGGRQGDRAVHRARPARAGPARAGEYARPSAAAGGQAAGASKPVTHGFRPIDFGYARLVENRLAEGAYFKGPCAVWFRLAYPLVAGEAPSPYQRVAVAADSGNGVSAALDFSRYVFVNCDLTINLFRRPVGEWICLDARSWIGGNACGLAESALYDEQGLIGRATQSLAVRAR